MNPVTARANPGTLIQLDQCGKCGGIWCDKWVAAPAPAGPAAKTLYCPRCTAQLQACSDPMLPKDLQLRRCWRCDGIWLNRGELRRYKKLQRKTRGENLGAEATLH